MRRRKGGIVLVVFGLFLAALVGGAVYVLAQGAESSSAEEMTGALKVVALVPERSPIPATALEVVQVPKSLKPATALSVIDQAVGKMALNNMYPGDWVLSTRIADTKGESGVSFTMAQGLVMVTFPASDIIGTGAVRRGDTVDIVVTVDTSKENGPVGPGAPAGTVSPGGITQFTIQNLKVEAIGVVATTATGQAQTTDANAKDKVITFAVSRQDALALKQIKDYPNSRAEIVLRAAGDQMIYTVDAVNMRRLIERFNIKVAP